jgi:hypothetical protein
MIWHGVGQVGRKVVDIRHAVTPRLPDRCGRTGRAAQHRGNPAVFVGSTATR